jgi:hypothetical protein
LNRPPKNSKSGRKPELAVPRGLSRRRGEENPPTPGRKWLFRLVALVVIPLAFLGAIEAGLRLSGYGYDTGLLKKITTANGEYFENNDAFGLRFFPPQMVRFLSPIRMPGQKPAGSYRIFIWGESAAMGDPEPACGAFTICYRMTALLIIDLAGR